MIHDSLVHKVTVDCTSKVRFLTRAGISSYSKQFFGTPSFLSNDYRELFVWGKHPFTVECCMHEALLPIPNTLSWDNELS
jgi:hypothetical protein